MSQPALQETLKRRETGKIAKMMAMDNQPFSLGLLSQHSVIDVLANATKIVGHFKHSPLAYSRFWYLWRHFTFIPAFKLHVLLLLQYCHLIVWIANKTQDILIPWCIAKTIDFSCQFLGTFNLSIKDYTNDKINMICCSTTAW